MVCVCVFVGNESGWRGGGGGGEGGLINWKVISLESTALSATNKH